MIDHGPHHDYSSPSRPPDLYAPWDGEDYLMPAWHCDACAEPDFEPIWLGPIALCGACSIAVMEVKYERHGGRYLSWPHANDRPREDKRKPIPAKLRTQVFERDAYRCRYCRSYESLSLDHVVPVVAGGTNTEENLVAACRACNSRKHGRTPEQAGMTLLPAPH